MPRLLLFSLIGLLAVGSFYLGRSTAPDAPTPTPLTVMPAPLQRGTTSVIDPTPTPAEIAGSPTEKGSSARAALAKLERSPGSEQREDERLRLLTEWAAVDPAAALQYAKANFRSDRLGQALTAVFSSWARKAPETAWNWVVTNMPGEMQHLNVMIGEVGKSDPALASRLVQDYSKQHPEAMQELLIAALQGMSYSGRFEDAKKVIDGISFSSDDERTAMVSYLAGQWGRYQPERVASWVQSLPPGSSRDQAISNLGEAWSDANPSQAADFAIKLPAGIVRQNALRQAISKWVMSDPDKARTWVINSDVHEDFDQALVSIATDSNLMSREPDRALRWASTIFDDELRFQSLSSVLTTLYTRDPNAALKYLRTSPDLTPEQRGQIEQQLQPPNGATPVTPAPVRRP